MHLKVTSGCKMLTAYLANNTAECCQADVDLSGFSQSSTSGARNLHTLRASQINNMERAISKLGDAVLHCCAALHLHAEHTV